jgi:hypothetical protein
MANERRKTNGRLATGKGVTGAIQLSELWQTFKERYKNVVVGKEQA